MSESDNPEEILGNYKRMMAECQQIAAKIQELTVDRDEHKLVVETMSKLEAERKAFRLVGGVLVERTVGEVLPAVSQNYEGADAYHDILARCNLILIQYSWQIVELLKKLDESLKTKDAERRAYKEKHGIMTQEEREAMLKNQNKHLTNKAS
eukprot:gene38307-46550_t